MITKTCRINLIKFLRLESTLLVGFSAIYEVDRRFFDFWKGFFNINRVYINSSNSDEVNLIHIQ